MPRGKESLLIRPRVCGTCDGKGYTLTRVNVTEMWQRECPTCKGKGVIEPKGAEMRERGFTLVEVLIVIVVIAYVTAIVVSRIVGAQQAATTIACCANMDAFASEIGVLKPMGDAPTQDQVREHLNWGDRYSSYWYVPNNSDFNKGHGNDLDGCDEENPGQSLPGRECIPMRFMLVCNHDTHGNNADAKYVFKTDYNRPMIVPYREYRHTYLLDANWWPKEDPGFDAWFGMVPRK